MDLSLVKTSLNAPYEIKDDSYRHSSFKNEEVSEAKTKNLLPAMGWNSWNAFGSGNTEALTKAMADKFIELELDKAGYEYLVLDDGCYEPKRTNDRLSNEPSKFPSGFKALADYIHSKGLKFGMYNDIGTNLCAGANVGTCGYEDIDSRSYIDWDVDFLKVDNCYYLWDNATFSNPENAKYTYAPNIRNISIKMPNDDSIALNAVNDGSIFGRGAYNHLNGYVTCIGTFDGTNTGATPVGYQYGELLFEVNIDNITENKIPCDLFVEYATSREIEVGNWLQVAVGDETEQTIYFDEMLEETSGKEDFAWSKAIALYLCPGKNIIRLMNHRRQENTLISYSAMLNGLHSHKPGNKILLSICEWGKTQPQNWGYKVGNSWRILNDITFNVGSDGDPGKCRWASDGTDSITSQYNKCVIMDEFSGLNRGWNDPDMMVIGMGDVDETMAKTHMTMWCMMNSPLMLGMDLRNIEKGDSIWNIIANRDAIALNQDKLGIQAKRAYCSLITDDFDKTYVTNNDRYDILAKPLDNGDIAFSFINLSENTQEDIRFDINKFFEGENATNYSSFNIWTKEEGTINDGIIIVNELKPHDNYTVRISVIQ